MSSFLKSKITFTVSLIFGIFLLFLAFFCLTKNTQAAATSTLRGAAWWGDDNSYVYFSCLDDIIGDQLDIEGNLCTPPDCAFHFYSEPCSHLVHGVYINNTSNNFSGEAWNAAKGLITFNATTSPPDAYAFNGPSQGNCPSCILANGCWACYNTTTQGVYGWARVVADGAWLKLNSATTTPVKLQSWDLTDSVLPGHDISAGDFVGTATSTAGDLSFNCESELGGTGANCSVRDYKVYIGNLQIGKLSAPNWNYSQACTGGALKAVLKWYLKSGQQTAYEVVVNDSDSLSTSTAICWSDKVTGPTGASARQYIVPNLTCPDVLNYNTNYYWWLRLYDENDAPTEWYQFGSGLEGLISEVTDGSPDTSETFKTYKHEFPSPYFSWSPFDVLVGTTTLFDSAASRYYTAAQPATPQVCSSSTCAYLWTTTDLGAIISNPSEGTTSIIFKQATGTSITLELTDTDTYVCSTSTTLYINYDLPLWREIKAQ